ncbi:MAG: DUF1080 domain-containing protein, partial [Pirellulaceae bacterium]
EFKDLYITELQHTPLFNGHDLAGWEGASGEAAQCWKVEEGLLMCTGEKGPWLRSTKEYGDFNLRLEYKLKPGGNSGVYVRVPADGNHHGDGAGVEIQVLDDHAERYAKLKPYQYTGSVYAIAPATDHVGREAGTWNNLEIDCRGASYVITHNGVVIVRADGKSFPEILGRRPAGFLGLQNHSEEVWYRNVRLGPSSQPETVTPAEPVQPASPKAGEKSKAGESKDAASRSPESKREAGQKRKKAKQKQVLQPANKEGDAETGKPK